MRHRLIRVAPVSAAKIAAVMYGVMSLVLVPFFMLPALFGPRERRRCGHRSCSSRSTSGWAS